MISIVLPSRNEEKNIEKVIKKIKKEMKKSKEKWEIIVIDKSEDNTYTIAKKFARAIKQKSKGKGNAIKEVIQYCKGDKIIFLDADGSYDEEKILEIAKLLDSYSFVRGVRKYREKGAMSLSHLIANKAFSILASLLYCKTADLLSGMYGIKKEVIKKLNLESKHFEIETEIHIKICKGKFKYIEIPIKYKRRGGKSKLSWKHGITILKTLIKGLKWKK